jgi:hypothetical protein
MAVAVSSGDCSYFVQSSKFKVQSSKFKVQGSRFRSRGIGFLNIPPGFFSRVSEYPKKSTAYCYCEL